MNRRIGKSKKRVVTSLTCFQLLNLLIFPAVISSSYNHFLIISILIHYIAWVIKNSNSMFLTFIHSIECMCYGAFKEQLSLSLISLILIRLPGVVSLGGDIIWSSFLNYNLIPNKIC